MSTQHRSAATVAMPWAAAMMLSLCAGTAPAQPAKQSTPADARTRETLDAALKAIQSGRVQGALNLARPSPPCPGA